MITFQFKVYPTIYDSADYRWAIALTGKGKGLFQTIKARDARAIKKMFSNVPEKDRCITQKTLMSTKLIEYKPPRIAPRQTLIT